MNLKTIVPICISVGVSALILVVSPNTRAKEPESVYRVYLKGKSIGLVEEPDSLEEYIDKELNAIVISKVKDKLNDTQFKLLKMFINGLSYNEMAARLNLTAKQVDNMLQSIKKKLKDLKGDF